MENTLRRTRVLMTATIMPSTFQIGRVGQALASITADDLAFVNDDQVLRRRIGFARHNRESGAARPVARGGLAAVPGGLVCAVAFFRPRNRTLASDGLGRR